MDAGSATATRRALEATVADLQPVRAAGATVGSSGQAWAIGFGPALGLARATALLLHEKARQPTVFCTPSEFRHGPIEAATANDVVILLDAGQPASSAHAAYLGRLAAELAELNVPLVTIAPRADTTLPIPAGASPAEATLFAFVRAQQLARVAAHARGTYADDFLVLRRIVRAADDLL